MRALVFSIDNAYVMPFKVLWHSLVLSDSIPGNTPVFILHDKDFSQYSIDELSFLIANNGFSCSFINASSFLPADLPIEDDDHVSLATFYRLYAARILPKDVKSAVYLDSDTLAVRSIRHLFQVELTSPVAAVDHLTQTDALRIWGDVSGCYFQAGVLVINIEAWRKNDYERDFELIIQNNRDRIKFWDQCILNIAFKDNWQRLPVWYNVCGMVRYYIDAKKKLKAMDASSILMGQVNLGKNFRGNHILFYGMKPINKLLVFPLI